MESGPSRGGQYPGQHRRQNMTPTAHNRTPKRITLKKHESIVDVMQQKIEKLKRQNSNLAKGSVELKEELHKLRLELKSQIKARSDALEMVDEWQDKYCEARDISSELRRERDEAKSITDNVVVQFNRAIKDVARYRAYADKLAGVK
jgi:DNA repair exonuclease SbcCD ATPase subunit